MTRILCCCYTATGGSLGCPTASSAVLECVPFSSFVQVDLADLVSSPTSIDWESLLAVLTIGDATVTRDSSVIRITPNGSWCGLGELRYSVASHVVGSNPNNACRSNEGIILFCVECENVNPQCPSISNAQEDCVARLPILIDLNQYVSAMNAVAWGTSQVIDVPAGFSVSIDTNGIASVTPPEDWFGTETFTWMVSDVTGCPSNVAGVMFCYDPIDGNNGGNQGNGSNPNGSNPNGSNPNTSNPNNSNPNSNGSNPGGNNGSNPGGNNQNEQCPTTFSVEPDCVGMNSFAEVDLTPHVTPGTSSINWSTALELNTSNAPNLVVVDLGDGSIRITPVSNWTGTESITYTVTDVNGCESLPASVNVCVEDQNPVDDCLIPDGAKIAYNGGGTGSVSCSVDGGGLDKSLAQLADFDIAVVNFAQQIAFATDSYSDSKADAFLTSCEKRVAVLPRWDIFFNYNFDNGVIGDNNLQWGNLCPMPTAEMGSVPRDAGTPGGLTWAQAVSILNAAGYVQNSLNAQHHPPELTTNPYRITLNPAAGQFLVIGNRSKVGDTAWLDLICCYLTGVVENTSITTVIVSPQKIQNMRSGANLASRENFHNWLTGTDGTQGVQGNPGWDLQSNSGGTNGPWPNAGFFFDEPAESICDLFAGMFYLADCLKANGVEVIFSLDNSTVRSNRSAVHWRQFQEEFVAKNAGSTFADARQWFWSEVERMAQTMEGILVDEFFQPPNQPPSQFQPYEPSPSWYADLKATSAAAIAYPFDQSGCQNY